MPCTIVTRFGFLFLLLEYVYNIHHHQKQCHAYAKLNATSTNINRLTNSADPPISDQNSCPV